MLVDASWSGKRTWCGDLGWRLEGSIDVFGICHAVAGKFYSPEKARWETTLLRTIGRATLEEVEAIMVASLGAIIRAEAIAMVCG